MRMLESESDKTNKSSPDIRSVPGCRGVELEGTGDTGAIYLHCLTFTLSIVLQKVFLILDMGGDLCKVFKGHKTD